MESVCHSYISKGGVLLDIYSGQYSVVHYTVQTVVTDTIL